MSHFTVAVITKGKPNWEDIEEIMAPYQENNMGTTRPEYLEFIPLEDDELEDRKSDYNSDTEECNGDNAPVSEIMTFNEYMNDEGYTYNEETNQYGYYSNPHSYWDWYQIGGRWCGELTVREGCDCETGERSWCTEEYDPYKCDHDGYIKCDSARIKDLVFLDEEKERQKARRFWEVYIEGAEPQNDEEREIVARPYYRKEYFLERYKDKETYARCISAFSTYAVITKDGEWHAQGEMGWFGISRTESDVVDWSDGYRKLVIDNAEEDDYITIVDCHI